MNFPYHELPDFWLWLFSAVHVVLLIITLIKAPWSRFQQDKQLIHVFLGSCVAMMVLWKINTIALPGLDYHYLGAMIITLMFGWQLAVLALHITLISVMVSNGSELSGYAVNLICFVYVPVMTSWLIYKIVHHRLPNHFFIYIFLNAFLGAGLALLTAIAVSSIILISGEIFSYKQLAYDYFPFIPLMIFPEGFLTGMIATLMVVYKPDWVVTFDDTKYLHNK